MNTIITWCLWLLLAETNLCAVQLIFRKREIKNKTRIIFSVTEFLFAAIFAVLVMAGPVMLRKVQPLMTALYAVLLPNAVISLAYSVFLSVSKKKFKFRINKCISVIFTVIFVLLGTVNSQTISASYHTYSSSKLNSEHKFVFVSDIHYGNAQNKETVFEMVDNIKAEDPEFIILGGDVTDDYTTKEEMTEIFEYFAGDNSIPIYFIYGNHDRQPHCNYANGQQYTVEELENTLSECGIILLQDDYAIISDDISLLGREDMSEKESRKDISALTTPLPSSYLIIADHQPVDVENNMNIGADLQLSGHTHAGQMFPLKVFYNLLICDACGDYSYGDSNLNVSPGSSGWRFPFRTEAKCQYEVIKLTSTK